MKHVQNDWLSQILPHLCILHEIEQISFLSFPHKWNSCYFKQISCKEYEGIHGNLFKSLGISWNSKQKQSFL